jgi:ABC-type lipoprotein export system ATPase subunit
MEEAVEAPTGLARYELVGLFGWRDISFELARGEPTLLTGANGTGKSTVLRTIHAVGSGNWLELHQMPFASLRLDFHDMPRLTIHRDDRYLTVVRGKRRWRLDSQELALDDPRGLRYRISHEMYEGTYITAADIDQQLFLERQSDVRRYLSMLIEREGADWVLGIPAELPVQFITDQRLVVQDAPSARPQRVPDRAAIRYVVDEYARDLARRVSDGLSQYGAHSQNLDRGFPERVVEAMASSAPADGLDLPALLEQVARERKALQEVALLEQAEVPTHFDERRLEDPGVRPVIQVFAETTLAKFATLTSLRRRLEVFVDFLNQHYVGKRIRIDREKGFVLELEDGSLLQPSDLSSGEQQMLVLAYQVLFRTEPGTLILVDEPELSLHVLWQSTLIDDLTTMGRAQNLSFILATHSPSLISSREDLRRSLDFD